MAEILPEIMEEEWMKFKFALEEKEIEQVLFEPMIMVPSSIDEKTGTKKNGA